MGYLFLSAALLCGAIKGFCGKKISGYATNLRNAALINLTRMALCVMISFCTVVISGNLHSLNISSKLLITSTISGISTASFIVTWLLAVRKNAYMMLDVFLMLGTLIPIIFGRFLFSEAIGIKRSIGFIVLIVAVIVMCYYNKSIKTKLTPSSLAILALCGISTGITDLSHKIATNTISGLSVEIFNLYTYVFATLVLLVFLPFIPREENANVKNFSLKPIVYILIMAGTLVANSYFKLQASFYLISIELYPLHQGGSLILSTFMATTLFKEKLKVSAILGIMLAFVALMIINL